LPIRDFELLYNLIKMMSIAAHLFFLDVGGELIVAGKFSFAA
jgi:hypothetical protein